MEKDIFRLEDRLAKVNAIKEKLANQVESLCLKNEALHAETAVKKAEREVEKEQLKLQNTQLGIEKVNRLAEEKRIAEKEKNEYKLKHLEARFATSQAKTEHAAALKQRKLQQKQESFDRRRLKSAYTGNNMVSKM